MSPNVEHELLTKVDRILTLLTGGLDEENGMVSRVNKHEVRLTSLEHWRWWLTGGLGLLAFLLVLVARFK